MSIKNFNHFISEAILYHGSNEKHNFSKSHGQLVDGSFFAQDKDVAENYGRYVYKVRLMTDKIFDPHSNKEHLDKLFYEFETLYDPYDDKEITKEEFKNHTDTWEIIEETDGVLRWIKSEGWHGVKILEGGSEVNYLLFYPDEDVKIIENINESLSDRKIRWLNDDKERNVGDKVSKSYVANHALAYHESIFVDEEDTDIEDRIYDHDYFVFEMFPLSRLDLDEYQISNSKVEKFMDYYLDVGDYPIIVIGEDNSGNPTIIDGLHRANALYELGHEKIKAFVGYK